MSKINVKAKTDRGFRRAGLQFGREGVDIDTKDLTKEQLEAIQNEPNLVVTNVEPEETPKQRQARERKEADDAAAADKDALAREKKATSTAEGKAAWEAAMAKVTESGEVTAEQLQALPAADRVRVIEAWVAELSK